MDEKVKKSKTEEICFEQNDRKKEKHMKKKKIHENDKTRNSDKILEANFIDAAADRQACSNDAKFTGNREEDGNISKKLKKKGTKDAEAVCNAIRDDKVLQGMGDNQKCKKKRKNCSDSLTGMQEMGSSIPNKKGKVNGDHDLQDHVGGPPLDRISTGDANAHSLVNEVDDQGKKMEKKKKKNKKEEKELSEKGDHSVVPNDQQDKETEKVISKKVKRVEEDSKTNKGDTESVVADISLLKSHEGEDHQGKKMKKKLSNKGKSKEKSKFKGNEDDQHCAKGNEGEDDSLGKQRKKKLSNKSKSKEKSEFKSNEDDQHCENSNEGDNDNLGKTMKKGKQSEESTSKESNEVNDQGKKTKINKKTKEGTTSKPKRVTFSDEVEVCCDGLIRGKWYTPEEDEKIKQAVFDYIESHQLGDEGVDMVINSRTHPELKNCWKEIGAALSYRPYKSVYKRAQILFTRDEKRKWTPEEIEFLKKMAVQHGSDWKSIADAMGKNRVHVKDAWRRNKRTAKTGPWSQDEYQKIFDLVSLDLRARALEDTRKKRHGMLRDNIGWEAIGDKLGTRRNADVCRKWYSQLTSPMVQQGQWSDTDDYRLVDALFALDACSMDEVDWDNLLEHRDGELCRKRWNQMVRHIGEHGRKSFTEQVEILAKRYCPDLLEAREAFDSKPVVC
ncbi:hypothetical protein PIB30_045052 [Stylosanthes scabra]|uniref:Uncharacterized protein n=1 Tax=Stylosanthes scabra TaxID=79078 RepID=A0ABU6TFR2_9FABA|nr:hypothetical protein [Stylosanthes scabra]